MFFNKFSGFIIVSVLIFSSHIVRTADQRRPAHEDERAIRFELPRQFPAFAFEFPRELPELHAELNANISANTMFSCLGLVMSILGSILIYKGLEKTAAGNCTNTPNAVLVNEGGMLNKYGAVLIACGLIALWHKSIQQAFSTSGRK